MTCSGGWCVIPGTTEQDDCGRDDATDGVWPFSTAVAMIPARASVDRVIECTEVGDDRDETRSKWRAMGTKEGVREITGVKLDCLFTKCDWS